MHLPLSDATRIRDGRFQWNKNSCFSLGCCRGLPYIDKSAAESFSSRKCTYVKGAWYLATELTRLGCCTVQTYLSESRTIFPTFHDAFCCKLRSTVDAVSKGAIASHLGFSHMRQIYIHFLILSYKSAICRITCTHWRLCHFL